MRGVVSVRPLYLGMRRYYLQGGAVLYSAVKDFIPKLRTYIPSILREELKSGRKKATNIHRVGEELCCMFELFVLLDVV